MAKYWYAYNGTGDPFEATSYKKLHPPVKPSCTSGAEICAIAAEGYPNTLTPNNPLSTSLRQYIAQALTDKNTPQPQMGKIYVYMRE